MFSYEFPKADVTADVIAFFDTGHYVPERTVTVVGIIRARDPFKGKRALPGGFLEVGAETLELCAGRELYEETGLVALANTLKLVDVRSAPDRDPRGHVISHVYAQLFSSRRELEGAHAGDDAAAIELVDFTFDKMVNAPYRYDQHGKLVGGGWMDDWAFDHAKLVGGGWMDDWAFDHAFSIKRFFDTYIER